MNTELLTQLGVAGVSLSIVLLVVKYFIKAIQEKDVYIEKLVSLGREDIKEMTIDYQQKVELITTKYQETVNDYITCGNKSREQHNEILQELIVAIRGWKN